MALNKQLLEEDACCEASLTLTVPIEAIWMVCLTVFIDSLGGSISAPVMPFYAEEFHASSSEVGLLFSTYSLAQVIALPLLGRLADRVGRRPVLVGSLFGAAAGAFCQGFAPSIGWLFLGRIVSGFCGAVGSTANVYICDVATEDCRPEYLGYLMSSNGLAFAFGPGLGGGLSKLGRNVPIMVNGALCLAAGLLTTFYLPESPAWVSHQQTCARREIVRQKPCKMWQTFSLSVWLVCAAEFLRGVSFSAIFAIFALFASDVYDLDSVSIGFAVCCGALCLIGTNIWVCPHLDAALGHVGCACLGMMLIAAGEVGLAYSPILKLSLVGMCVVYVGQAVAGCTIATITSVLATDDNRGAVMSMQQMAQALGRVFGPVVLSFLFSRDPRDPYACAAVAALIGSAVLYSLRSSFSKRARIMSIGTPIPLPAPPPWSKEEFTAEDVEDMGRFMCHLLTSRHYQWRDPQKRVALKKNLEMLFPPLSSEAQWHTMTNEEGPKNFGSLNGQADPSASISVGQFVVRNTPGSSVNRRRFKSMSRNNTLDLPPGAMVSQAKTAVRILNGELISKDRPYGTVEGAYVRKEHSSFTPGRRKRLNLVAIFINLVAPWALFCGIFAALSFQLHYWSSSFAWSSVAVGLLCAAVAAFLAHRTRMREQDPTWCTFAALAYLTATLLAAFFGDMNYWYNMQPYYDIESINSYPNVSPARERGQQLMDAGRVYFEDGTVLDTSKSMSFKNLDRYCVAPIISGEAPLSSYDFWAVGVNCCGSSTSAFRCGEYNNPKARAGLRLMRDDQRPFFRLAVQQAEAAYNIKANHPIFFEWLQDPVAEVLSYKTSGFSFALIAVASHFVFNLLCVAGATFAFSKLAHEF
ncbi:unnamed protein product [Effrenium voratum]|uniref:Major facilitator superfamily (MFS) profile domain-containing protein n=1 Tax=Effrenium voratum TaxID=2562239 RepID=A0AA36JJ25_9DINO|nr:unnamed protein product [Effrenium voratum]